MLKTRRKMKRYMIVSVATLGLISPSILTAINANQTPVHADALSDLVNSHDDKGQDSFDNNINNNGSQYQGGFSTQQPQQPAYHQPVYHRAYVSGPKPAPVHHNYNHGVVRRYRPRRRGPSKRAIAKRKRAIRRQRAIRHARWLRHQRYLRRQRMLRRRRLIARRRRAHESWLRRTYSSLCRNMSHRLWQMGRAIRYHWHRWGRVCSRIIRGLGRALARIGRHIRELF